jgi:outer membrane protein assembly factor BamB
MWRAWSGSHDHKTHRIPAPLRSRLGRINNFPSRARQQASFREFNLGLRGALVYAVQQRTAMHINPLVLAGLAPFYMQAAEPPLSPAVLPGSGLAQHDFFSAGEAKAERMLIVRGGKIVWSYEHPGKGEISDAALLPNGNILFAHQFAITEITPNKKVVWNYDAPPATEIHTAQPTGSNSVVFIQNGDPAKAIVVNKVTGSVEHEFALPVKNPKNIHPQFRRARLTNKGTLLVAHLDLGKVVEYDLNGNLLWSVEAPGAWSASALENGNVLIAGSSRKYVREVNRKGDRLGVHRRGRARLRALRSPDRDPPCEREHDYQQLD